MSLAKYALLEKLLRWYSWAQTEKKSNISLRPGTAYIKELALLEFCNLSHVREFYTSSY
jgi:hypothetical protein